MRVQELLEKLQEMNPDLIVNFRLDTDPEYGSAWITCSDVTCQSVGWNDDMGVAIYEVFIE